MDRPRRPRAAPADPDRPESTRRCSTPRCSWRARWASTRCRWTTSRSEPACRRRRSTDDGRRRKRWCSMRSPMRSGRSTSSTPDRCAATSTCYLRELGHRMQTGRTSDVLPDLISASARDAGPAGLARRVGPPSSPAVEHDPRSRRCSAASSPPTPTSTSIIDALIGAFMYRRLLSHAPLDAAFVDAAPARSCCRRSERRALP